MAIGMPNIEINFKQLAVSAVARSARGIVALIVKDITNITFSMKEYKLATDIETALFTPANIAYIKQVFAGGVNKVLVVRVPVVGLTGTADAVTAIGSRKYNYIGFAEGTVADQTDLVTYVKSQELLKKSIKAVVFNATAPDSQHIINFTNTSVTYATGTTVTGEKYIARLLGLFGGLSLLQSSTYLTLADLSGVVGPTDSAALTAAINAGKLVLFNDDDKVRIARGVNSLITYTAAVTESMSKIIVVESMDLIRDDIYSTFKNTYIGKFKNVLDNQMLFVSSINAYFQGLANEGILDNSYNNVSFVDVEAQRLAWLATGKTEASEWDAVKVRTMTFRSNVYLAGSIKIADAMEDFVFNITME